MQGLVTSSPSSRDPLVKGNFAPQVCRLCLLLCMHKADITILDRKIACGDGRHVKRRA